MDVPFLPRQTFVGATTYYSNAFETGDYNKLVVIFKSYGTIGTSPTGEVPPQWASRHHAGRPIDQTHRISRASGRRRTGNENAPEPVTAP